MPDTPGWVRDAIWWHVYPLGFTGAPRRADEQQGVARRLPHLHAWLDHVVELGLNGVALGPVFASSTHGYDTTDHIAVDRRLGTEADLVAFIDAAHAKGLRVMLDGVFNHVGSDHPAFRAVREHGPGAATADWFDLSWPDGGTPGSTPRHRNFEGHDHLVALEHTSPSVVDLVVDVMAYWCDRGVDAWRLDAAYAVPPSFWAQVLPRVRTHHPDVYVMGEVIHGDYARIVAESSMDSVTQYELWKALRGSVNDANFYELDHALGRHDEFLDAFVPYTFVGNHDVTRIASALGDPRHLAHVLVVLFTVGGTPAVYYGDELAYRGVKEEREGGDDDIRPSFPPTPAGKSGLGADTLALHQELIGLRRRHPWLHTARTQTLHLANTAYAYAATGADGERLVAALNLADDTAQFDVGDTVSSVLAGAADVDGHRVHVPAHGWAILAA